jgi:protein-L-isoaspartate(D-aspartate) O-methyltransferase
MMEQDQLRAFSALRQEMVRMQLRARGITDARVLEAMGRVPREEFVSAQFQSQAYADHPIPIGEGQSISQPYIVAVTVEALQLSPSSKVLEIGTGSGYQTAILAWLSLHVYSVERHAALASAAEATLKRLGFQNVTISTGDGSQGWPSWAPYDAIAVSAAAPAVPKPLLDQLRPGGRIVIPVGPPESQSLELIEKKAEGLIFHHLEGCRFVPLIGAEAYPSN